MNLKNNETNTLLKLLYKQVRSNNDDIAIFQAKKGRKELILQLKEENNYLNGIINKLENV